MTQKERAEYRKLCKRGQKHLRGSKKRDEYKGDKYNVTDISTLYGL